MAKNLVPENTIGSSGRLTVNLTALQHNYKILQAHAYGAEVAAVVKADAYGLGAAALAPALYDAGCRLFFVAQLAEAFTVRAALAEKHKRDKRSENKKQKTGNIKAVTHKAGYIHRKEADNITIAILNDVLPHEAAPAAQAGFVPVLNCVDSVRIWAALCRSQGRKLPAMLQCDSGMARLGLDGSEIQALLHESELLEAMEIKAILSHLACGDEEKSPMNAAQEARFLANVKVLSKVAHYRPPVSLAASSGLTLGAEFCMDIVRPGLALYGLVEGGRQASILAAGLRSVISLEGRILRIGQVRKGETIGYGASYKATKNLPIATISVGYADGWPRSLSNKGAIFYHGVRLPIIGRISMDCMVVDLSPPAGTVSPERGDWVELIGPHQTLHDIARDAGTVAYEILTSLGHRYERHYCAAPKPAAKGHKV